MEVKVTKLPKPTVDRKWDTYTVEAGGRIIGLLEKWRNTRTDKHPWKAFKGHGKDCTFLKAFYPEEGGKDAAILAVVHAAGLCPCEGDH